MQSVNRQVWGQNFIKASHFSIKGFSNSHIYYFTTTVNICYCGIFFWGEHKVSSQNHAAELISQNMFQCLCLSNVTRNQCKIRLNLLYVFHCCYFLGIILVCMALSTKKRYVQCDPITIYTMPSSLWVNLLTMAGILQTKWNFTLQHTPNYSDLSWDLVSRPEIIQVWNMQTLKFGVCFRGHCQESNCPVCCV